MNGEPAKYRCAPHFTFLAFLLASFGCGGGGGVPKASFEPSKETTFITEPVDVDGYLDYETALNERLRRTVTPETNAMVLFWQANGPKGEGREMPPRLFQGVADGPPGRRWGESDSLGYVPAATG